LFEDNEIGNLTSEHKPAFERLDTPITNQEIEGDSINIDYTFLEAK